MTMNSFNIIEKCHQEIRMKILVPFKLVKNIIANFLDAFYEV